LKDSCIIIAGWEHFMSDSHRSLPHGISVIVPVYNSEGTLADLIARLGPVLQGMGRPFELVLVNDGSRDGSWKIIERLAGENDWVRGIDLMRNQGQENALLCGIRAARYDATATIDDDLQNPPEEIPRLVGRLEEGFDVVYGTPEKEQHGLFRDLASIITKLVMQEAMGATNARNVTAFKVFRTQLREAFSRYRSPHVSIDVLLTWGTQNFGSLTVRHDPRAVGQSNFTLRKLVNHAINMLTGFSVVPLQLASLMGLAFAFLGLLALAYVVLDFIFRGDPVPGFPFLAALIAIFSGAQLFALGIIGEYLARIHLRSMDRLPYTVRRSVGATDADMTKDAGNSP
jgi:undecaprenyl-phosphate 4-deoxy-4-formamido-L-arabinose transferase